MSGHCRASATDAPRCGCVMHVETQPVIRQGPDPCDKPGLQAEGGIRFELIDTAYPHNLVDTCKLFEMAAHRVALLERGKTDKRGNSRIRFGLLQYPSGLVERAVGMGVAFEKHHRLDVDRPAGGPVIGGQMGPVELLDASQPGIFERLWVPDMQMAVDDGKVRHVRSGSAGEFVLVEDMLGGTIQIGFQRRARHIWIALAQRHDQRLVMPGRHLVVDAARAPAHIEIKDRTDLAPQPLDDGQQHRQARRTINGEVKVLVMDDQL